MLPQVGEHLCVRTYVAGNRTQAVVERDDALLTPDEVSKHWAELLAAMELELRT